MSVNDDAIGWITHCVPPKSLERVFILYPNPYPKRGQANKRWHLMPFMGHLRGCLKPQGQLLIATNMAFYAEEAREHMVQTWGFRMVRDDAFSIQDRPAKEAHTHFERKYLERGERCFEMLFEVVP